MKIKILGQKNSGQYKAKLKKQDWFDFTPSHKYKTLGGSDINYHDLLDDETVEVTLNDKITLCLSSTSFLSLMPESSNSSLNLTDCALQIDDVSKQANIINIHSIRFIQTALKQDDNIPQTLSGFITELENNFIKEPGIYKCDELNRHITKVSNPLATITTRHPILLLIHGTAANAKSTFNDLWQSVESHQWLDHLEDNYDGHVYAYEHHTLSTSPIQNALDLVRELPKDTCLHLVTHSRGGLIGELLSRGQMENNIAPFTDEEISLFDETERIALEALNIELINRRIKIERFVRVACPARGTTFADNRPDIYFSILLNTLGFIPALKDSHVYNFVQNLLSIIAIHHARAEDLPGLAGMLPDSTLIRTLNGSSVRSEADLSIIAGDIEGAGAFKILELLTTHFFFLEQHDLIVNTSSMTGGVRRTEGSARRFFHQGPQVSHLHYFSNPASVENLVNGLAWKAGYTPDNFDELESSTKKTRSSVKSSKFDPQKATVVIIPGIFGSHIKPENERIWINWNALSQGDFVKLKLSSLNETIDSEDGLVAEKYEQVIQFLSRHYNVIPFPYDWRLSLSVVAKRLAAELNSLIKATEENTQPIHLLAHSTGGLLARLVANDETELWKEISSRGSRLLMLGTPHRGSFAIPRILMGKDRLTKLLPILHYKYQDNPTQESEIIEVLTSFPGLLELMPYRSEFSYYNAKKWKDLKTRSTRNLIVPTSTHLKVAKELLSKQIASAPVDETMFTILGKNLETPDKYDQQENTFSITEQGDGFSTWKSSKLPNVKTWYMDTSHGDLVNQEQTFPALYQILETGETALLQNKYEQLPTTQEQHPPSLSRSIIFPSRQDVLDASMPVTRITTALDKNQSQLNVQVTYGDLNYAQHPVLTGHYDGESIRGAEVVFDSILDGHLTNSFSLGLYPGPIRTSEVFLETTEPLKGCIIVGLGRIGTLSDNKLRQSIVYGLLDYVTTLRERRINHGGILGISFLLLANDEGGLTTEGVVHAVLRAVVTANAALESDLIGQIKFTHVEFIEKYLDKAAKAAYSLKALSLSNEFKSIVNLNQSINTCPGGKERITNTKVNPRWQSLQIISLEGGELSFTSMTKKARVEATVVSTQRKLIDRFIDSSISTTQMDSGLSTTLFELIVPLEFKLQIHEQNDIQLILDEETARYPWELLQARSISKDKPEKPFSVRSGVVRQLIQDDYRRQPSLAVSDSVLIIGDPALGSQKTRFLSLPGAKKEAIQVDIQLTNLGYKTNLMLQEASDVIIQALYEAPYRIVHLAGHGVYEYNDDDSEQGCYTGMVLGDGIYLSAKEIAQMSNVPDIVFVNCCHSGFIEKTSQPNKLAANLASQLIKNGVICVIAAGWAVNDDEAKIFAENFYQEMLENNETFGKAVFLARQAVFDNYPNSNTWGAYQCYGPHDFRMQHTISYTENKRTTDIKSANDFTLPKELSLALDTRSSELQQCHPSSAEIQSVRQELKNLTRSLPPMWRKDGLLLSSIGNIYSVLGEIDTKDTIDESNDFKYAADYYKKAFNADISNFSFYAIEKYAHVDMCKARCLKNKYDNQWEELFDAAIQKLKNLTDIAPSSHRFALLGKAYKQKAMLLEEKVDADILEDMQKSYDRARKIAEERTGLLEPESAFNYLLALAAKKVLQQKSINSTSYMGWVDQLGSILSQSRVENRSLQTETNVLDNQLVKIILNASVEDNKFTNISSLERKLSTIRKSYLSLLEDYEPDDAELNHCLESYNFLYDICSNIRSSDGHAIRNALRQ